MNKYIAALFGFLALIFAPVAYAQYYPPASSGWKLISRVDLTGTGQVTYTYSSFSKYNDILFVIENAVCTGPTHDAYFSTYTRGGSSNTYGSKSAICTNSYNPYGLNGAWYIPQVNAKAGMITGSFGYITTPNGNGLGSWNLTNGAVGNWSYVDGLGGVSYTVTGGTFISGYASLYGRD